MSIGQVIVLAAIVGAFVLFAVTLGWGDYRAQQLARRIGETDRRDGALAANATAVKQESAGAAQAQWPKAPNDHLKHAA